MDGVGIVTGCMDSSRMPIRQLVTNSFSAREESPDIGREPDSPRDMYM